jgi:O-antigen/teichoic acid export membrane protein
MTRLEMRSADWRSRLFGSVRQALTFARTDFARDIIGTIATRVALTLIGVVSSVLVARALGPDGRGQFAAAIAIGAIAVQFANLGLHASNTWTVSRDPGLLGPVVANSLLVSIVGGIAAGAIVGIVAAILPAAVPIKGTLLLLAMVSVPSGLAYLYLTNLLIAVRRIKANNLIELASRLGAVALLVWLVVARVISPELVVAVSVAVLALGACAALYLLTSTAEASLRPRLVVLRTNLGYGGRAYWAALLSFLVIRFDLILVANMRGSTEAGYYSVAVSIGDLLYLPAVVVGALLFPRLAAMVDAGQRWAIAATMARGIAVLFVVGAILAVVLSDWLVRLLFGEEFAPSAAAFRWLAPGIVALAVHTVLMNYLAAVGMPLVTMVGPASGLTLSFILNLALIPPLGAIGASLSSSLAYGLMLGVSVWYFVTHRPVPEGPTSPGVSP